MRLYYEAALQRDREQRWCLLSNVTLYQTPLVTFYEDDMLSFLRRLSYFSLKGLCHEIENWYNGFQVLDLNNVGLPEHMYFCFNAIFTFTFLNSMLWRYLVTVTLWMMSNNRRSFSSTCTSHIHSIFNRYVTPRMNSSVMLLTGWACAIRTVTSVCLV